MRRKLLIFLTVGMLCITGCSPEKQSVSGTKQAAAGGKQPQVTVYLSGFVQSPGTYHVQLGTDLGEVIKLAGGFRPEADPSKIDLHTIVRSTIQVNIPSVNDISSLQRNRSGTEPLRTSQVADTVRKGNSASSAKVVRGNPSADLTSQEEQMLDLINSERESIGVKPLVVDARLHEAARLKSQDMVDNNYFDHESPKYGAPSAMIAAQGVSYHYCGENIAVSATVEQAHKGLMGSPGHRQAILNPSFRQIGIGIIQGSQGLVVSQEFTD